MKNLKQFFSIFLALFIFGISFSQEASKKNDYVGHVTLLKRTALYIGAGTTTPGSETKDLGFGNPINANLGFYQSLWNNGFMGFGLHAFGNYTFGNGIPKSVAEFPISGYTSTISTSATPKNSGFYVGIGPQIDFALGEKVILSPMVDFAYVANKLEGYSITQNYSTTGATGGSLASYSQPEIKISGLGIIPRIKLEYFFAKGFGIWLEGNYSLLPKFTTTTSTFVPNGTANQGGAYNIDQIKSGTIKTQEISVKNAGIGFGGGIVVRFNNPPTKGKTDTMPSRLSMTPTTSRQTQGQDSGEKVIENNGEAVFTSTPIKKEKPNKNNCIKILSPSNGSNQNNKEDIKILLSNEDLKNSKADIKIYKISNDANYWNKAENKKEMLNTNNTAILSGKFEKESQETGFKPISIDAKQSGAVLESTLEKGKLSDGAYKMVVMSNCGVTTSNFMVTNSNCSHSVTIKSINCIGIDQNGNSKYRVCVDYKNTATTGCTNCTILLNNPSNHSGTVVQSANVNTTISNISTIPSTLTAGNTASICFDTVVNSGNNLQVWILGTCQDGLQNSTNPNYENSLIDEQVKPCICDFCEKVLEFDNNQSPNATYSATSNSLSIHQDWWNMNTTAATIVGAKAEIISFEREVSDDCFKCDKDSNSWGNFISGTSGTSNGSFGNTVGSVSGSTHHTLYFANPNSYSFDLNISLPPLSTLKCCCEKIRFKVRYTYSFRDKNGECKMCSAVFEYFYQRGSCPKKIPTDWNPLDATAVQNNHQNLKN